MAYNNNTNYNFNFGSPSEQTNNQNAVPYNFDPTISPHPAGNTTSPAFDFGDIIRPHNEGPWVGNQPRLPTNFRFVDFESNAARAHTVADPANITYVHRPVFNPRESFTTSPTDDSAFCDGQSIADAPDTSDFAPFSAQSYTPNPPARPTSTRSAPVNRRKRPRSQGEEIPCREEGCDKIFKSNSELTKHQQQHDKPHICREPDCPRKGEGFSTENDLDRHQKSVHKMARRLGNCKEYVCAECRQTSNSEPRTWDRRDNFKSHVKRRHPGVDADSVIARSEKRPDSGFGGSQITESPVYQDTLTSDSAFMSATMSRNGSYNSEVMDNSFPQQQPDSFLAGIGAGQMPGNFNAGNSLSPTVQYPGRRSFSPQMPQIATTIGQTGPLGLSQSQLSPSYPTPDPVSMSYGSYFGSDGMGPAQTDAVLPQPASTVYPSRSARNSVTETAISYICPTCFKEKKRPCDLRKHEKRHTRPYGCTFAGCEMRLGSRNDWKRHESSQHHLKEMWWCSQCRKTFEKEKTFAIHLEQAHSIPVGSVGNRKQCKLNHLGPEAHFNFWCGFCDKLIPQEDSCQSEMDTGISAWEYRFKHIGDHYDKEERKIEDWTCPDQPQHSPGLAANPTKNTPSVIRSQHRTSKDANDGNVGEYGSRRPSHEMAPPGFRATMRQDVRRQATTTTAGNANTATFYDDTKDADGEDDNGY